MNQVILNGRICNDVELRYLDNGKAVTTITLAVDRPKKNGDKETDFPRINIFDKQAEALQKYSGKGKRILVEGRLRTGDYDKSGEKVYFTDVNATRVEFIDFNQKTRQNENESVTEGYYEQRYGNQGLTEEEFETLDELCYKAANAIAIDFAESNQGFKAVDPSDIPF